MNRDEAISHLIEVGGAAQMAQTEIALLALGVPQGELDAKRPIESRLTAGLVTFHDMAGRELHRAEVVDGQPVQWQPDREVAVQARVWLGDLRVSNALCKMLGPGDVLTVPVDLTASEY